MSIDIDILFRCKTVEDIFNNKNIDIRNDYREIISHCTSWFSFKDVEDIFKRIIANGNTDLISENIDVLTINENWNFSKEIPEFREIFLTNFEKALLKSNYINQEVFDEMYEYKQCKDFFNANIPNFIKHMSMLTKKDFMKKLSTTQIGKDKLNDNLEYFFESEYGQLDMITYLSDKQIVSKQRILEMVIQDPIKLLNGEKSAFSKIQLLEQINGMLNEVEISQDKKIVVKSRIEDYICDNFEKMIVPNYMIIPNYIIIENDMILDKETECNYCDVKSFETLKKFNTAENKINSKIFQSYDQILKSIPKTDLVEFMSICKDIEGIEKIDDTHTYVKKMFDYITDENVLWAIETVTNELLSKENINISDVEFVGKGRYSKAIKIGEYVLKLGSDRETTNIPYDERIVQPIIRRVIPFDHGDNDKYKDLPENKKVYIEVQNLVEKDWTKGMSEEEINQNLYEIYSEMRDRGVIWTDVKKENVGRLIKPNKENYQISGNDLESDSNAIGIIKEGEKNILEQGELVVIDTDYIYRKGDINIKNTTMSRRLEFEKKYQNEKLKDTVEKFTDFLKEIDVQVSAKDREQGICTLKTIKNKDKEKDDFLKE